jgi:GNAT superfamily N-acetyltransferase
VTELLPIREEHIPDCLDVFYMALDELHERLAQPPIPRNPEALAGAFAHLIGTDPGACWLAVEGGRAVAFGMAHQRGDHWYLGFLFVVPQAQGRGLGRAVLERCLPHDRTGMRLSVCVEAIQPVSTALYAQYGMVPRVPLYVLIGDLPAGALPDPLSGLGSAGVEATAFAALEDPDLVAARLDTLDREIVGYRRPSEHRFLAVPDRLGFFYGRPGGDQPLAYGYAQPSGRLGPVATRDPALLTSIVGHLAAAVRPAGEWQVIVPGPAAEALLPLMRAGLRMDGPPALFCGTWDGPQFDRYLPMNFALG